MRNSAESSTVRVMSLCHGIEAIYSALTGNDVVVLMPTGGKTPDSQLQIGGKSLCYQIPPLVRNGMCIVVSPLIALMQDQCSSSQMVLRIVRELRDRNIPCCYLSSSQSASEYRSVMGGLKNPKTICNALFVTPERFQVSEFIQLVQNLHKEGRIILIAIDEAHCISTFSLFLLCDLQMGT